MEFIDFDIKGKDKNLIMELIFHSCDISNPIKPWDNCSKWADKVL
jgi:hypothetical protein